MRNEIEDGMGCAGLVPDPSEKQSPLSPDDKQFVDDAWDYYRTGGKKCIHPPDKTTFDILQGDWPAHAVNWCRICGSFRVTTFTDNLRQRIKDRSPWVIPESQSAFTTRKPLAIK